MKKDDTTPQAPTAPEKKARIRRTKRQIALDDQRAQRKIMEDMRAQRDAAIMQRDAAIKERDEAVAERDRFKARSLNKWAESAHLKSERDKAIKERDEALARIWQLPLAPLPDFYDLAHTFLAAAQGELHASLAILQAQSAEDLAPLVNLVHAAETYLLSRN